MTPQARGDAQMVCPCPLNFAPRPPARPTPAPHAGGGVGGYDRQQLARHGPFQQRSRPQQASGIRQQRHRPGEAQPVEKQAAQAQLALRIGLRRLNLRTHRLPYSLPHRTGQGQAPQQRLVLFRPIRKLARTARGFPALPAELRLRCGSKPVFPSRAILAQPRQRFSLRAGGLIPSHIRRHQFHVAAELGQDGHLPTFTALSLGRGRQVAHVGHDQRRAPIPWPLALGASSPPSDTLAGVTQLSKGTNCTPTV